MRNHFIKGLEALAAQDANTYLMTGDLGFGVLNGFAEKFPDRFINAGISEQNMTAVAAGLALDGNTVYTYSIGNFPTLRCLEQIRNDVCYHNANVKIVVVGGGLAYGQLGMSHHATEDLAIMRALPNMRVFSPADPAEALEVLQEVHRVQGPCYIRLGKGGEENLHPAQSNPSIYQAVAVSVGTDVNILATGSILKEALGSAQLLREKGLSVGVSSYPCVKPMDAASLRAAASASRLIVTLEEHNRVGGFGSAVAEVLSEIRDGHAPLLRIGMNDNYSSIVGSQQYLRRYYHLDAESVCKQILEWMECAL